MRPSIEGFFRRAGMALALTIVAAGAGCSDSGSGTGPMSSDFDSINQTIFQARCASSGCHGAATAANLDLRSGAAYDNLVGAASTQVPSMLRVEAGNAANSYLVHKIKGTAASVGGVDSRMPLGGSSLSEADIQRIVDWIDAGAKR